MFKVMKLKAFVLASALVALTGCSTTVRLVTATEWISTGGAKAAGGGGAAPEIPAAAPAAGGAAAPAAAAPAAGASSYVLYVAYWEGSCSKGIFGASCDRGDSKIKRCNVAADNTMVCKEEADANRALSAETK